MVVEGGEKGGRLRNGESGLEGTEKGCEMEIAGGERGLSTGIREWRESITGV